MRDASTVVKHWHTATARRSTCCFRLVGKATARGQRSAAVRSAPRGWTTVECELLHNQYRTWSSVREACKQRRLGERFGSCASETSEIAHPCDTSLKGFVCASWEEIEMVPANVQNRFLSCPGGRGICDRMEGLFRRWVVAVEPFDRFSKVAYGRGKLPDL